MSLQLRRWADSESIAPLVLPPQSHPMDKPGDGTAEREEPERTSRQVQLEGQRRILRRMAAASVLSHNMLHMQITGMRLTKHGDTRATYAH